MKKFHEYMKKTRAAAEDNDEDIPNVVSICKRFVEEVANSTDTQLQKEVSECVELQNLLNEPSIDDLGKVFSLEEMTAFKKVLSKVTIRELSDATWVLKKAELASSSDPSARLPTADALLEKYKMEWCGSFPVEDEVVAHLQSLELILRQSLQIPSSVGDSNNTLNDPLRRIHTLLSQRQEDIQMLRACGAFKISDGQYPSVCWCNEVVSLRRLLMKWATTNSHTRRTACTVGSSISKFYNSPHHRTLEAALDAELAQADYDSTQAELLQRGAHLEELLLQAARHTPMAFPDRTLAFLRRLYKKDAVEPTATPSDKMKKGPKSAETQYVETNRNRADEDEEDRNNSHQEKATKSASPGIKRQREVADNDETDDEDDGLSIRQVAAKLANDKAPKVPKKTDLLNGPVAHRAPVPTKLEYDDILDWIPAAQSATTTSASTAAASFAPTTAVLPTVGLSSISHRHPCRSKYHSKYSSPDKHASSACSYCSACHLMEFLFNGCIRDCSWKHFPSQKKVALHLKQHPAVYALAMRRLPEIMTPGGTSRLKPCQLPE